MNSKTKGGDPPAHTVRYITLDSVKLLAGCFGLWPSKIESWRIDPEFDRAEEEGFELGQDPKKEAAFMNARTATQTLMP